MDSNDVDVVTNTSKNAKGDQAKANQAKAEQPKVEQSKVQQSKVEQSKQSKITTNKELPDAGDTSLMARLSAIPVLGLGFAMLRRRKERED